MEKKGFTRKWSSKFNNKKPHIFYLGTNELQDKSGFIQALEKVAEVSLFYKCDNSYGQYKIDQNPISSNRKRLFELFYELNNSNNLPDILLMQTWEWRIGVENLLELKKKYNKLKIINICMDDRHAFYHNGISKKGTFGLIPALDFVLNSTKEAVDWYMKEGVPALYFPEASSLDFYHPMNVKKKYDVGFVGAKYGIRAKIVRALIQDGVNVMAYGSGWDNGRLPIHETNRFFNECRIILGIGTIGHCEDFFALKLRDFDAPMSGSCYVTHNNSDLHELFDANKENVLCNNEKDFVRKIKYLLSHPKKLNSIAESGFNKASSVHTYEQRFVELYNVLHIPYENNNN